MFKGDRGFGVFLLQVTGRHEAPLLLTSDRVRLIRNMGTMVLIKSTLLLFRNQVLAVPCSELGA